MFSLEELIKTRQSCRDFNDKPLEKETVEKIAELAMLAPSACNSQPWKMYLVTTPEKVTETAIAVGMKGHNKFLNKAKAFIVFADQQAALKPNVKFDRNHFVKYDVGELIAYVTLIAKDMGVESCIIGMVDQKLIVPAVGLKKGEICNIVVALGYSDIPIREKKRKKKEDIIQFV